MTNVIKYMNNKHSGSSFNDFLKTFKIEDEVQRIAIEKILISFLEQNLKQLNQK